MRLGWTNQQVGPPKTQQHHFVEDLQSHALLQTYGAILPTSLTYIVSIGQRLFTLETCCGYWYGQKQSQIRRKVALSSTKVKSCPPTFTNYKA